MAQGSRDNLMAGRTPEETSRNHIDQFLRRRHREEEDLARDIGHPVLAKLHPWVVGDLLAQRREAQLASLFEAEAAKDGRIAVMVNMRTAQREPPAPLVAEEVTRGRAPIRDDLRRAAELALGRLKQDLAARGVEVASELWLTHSVTANLNSEQIINIAARGDVASITSEKRQFVTTLNASRPLIRADQVEAVGITGAGITVAIQDTGIDFTHAALNGVAAGPQQDMTGTAVAGMPDGLGHGTHVAGIVASRDATFRGIAPGAALIDIRVMDDNGSAQPSWCTAGFQAAVDSRADVSNNSWGFTHADGAWTDPDGTCVLCTAANNAVAAGVVVVVAGGNEDNDSCSSYDTHLRCPAIAASVITVAASNDSDNIADFSSVGPTPDGRAKPDVTAPGVDIASCQAAGTMLGTIVAPGFINLSGTSMACPHVSGLAALILSKKGKPLSPADVKGLIMGNVVDIGAPADQMGQGRVDALAAVNAA